MQIRFEKSVKDIYNIKAVQDETKEINGEIKGDNLLSGFSL